MKAFRALQMGAQYLLFTQSVMKKKAEMETVYAEFEEKNYEKLKVYGEKQRRKIRRLKEKLGQVEESVRHCEVMNKARLEREEKEKLYLEM